MEVEQGLEPELGEDEVVGKLRRAVAGDEQLPHSGAEPDGDESGHTHSKAVEDDRPSGCAGAEHGADEGGELEPAEAAQDLVGTALSGLVSRDGLGDGAGEKRQPSGSARRTAARESSKPSGRGGRMNPPPPAVSRDDDGLTALSLRHHGP